MKQWIHISILTITLLLPQSVFGQTILVMGDSLSAAYGVPVEAGWVSLLSSRLQEKGFSSDVINESISGETTDGGLRRLPDILQRTSPDIILIELGANDGLRGFPLEVIKNNLNQLIRMALDAKAQVILLGMHIPPNYGPVYTRQFHENYQAAAQENNVPLVPFFLDGVAAHEQYMQADGLHPNAAGQPIILENIWQTLKVVLH